MRKSVIPKEFLGAFKAGHRPSARPFIDEELAHHLLRKVLNENCETSRAHLAYITKFNNEYYRGVVKAGDSSALHSSDEERRECYKRNYRQRMDATNFAAVGLPKLIRGF